MTGNVSVYGSFQCNLNQSYLFTDCDIVGKVNGVCFTYSKEGRPSGEAFIELITSEDFKNALSKDRKYMGHRYIEGKQYNRLQPTDGPVCVLHAFGCLYKKCRIMMQLFKVQLTLLLTAQQITVDILLLAMHVKRCVLAHLCWFPCTNRYYPDLDMCVSICLFV